MSHGQPRIVFLTLSDDVGSERIVSEMGRRGAACAVLGRAGAVASRSRHVALHQVLSSRGGAWAAARGVRRGLEALSRGWGPDAVVPLDDLSAGVLRELAASPRARPALRRLISASLGDPAHHGTACCRALLIEAAGAMGLRTPAQRRARSLAGARDAAAQIGYPLMLKREGTCGGSGVALVRDAAALAGAYRAAARKAWLKRAVLGLFGFGRVRGCSPLTLQAHVAGRLAMRTVACEAGRVLAGISFLAERLDPPATGSSTVVRPLDHPEMEAAALRLVAALGCSGFVSFDFILSPGGAAHLIEMNARPVGSGHLGARFGHDVYGAWLRSFPGFRDADPPPEAEAPRAVALFPKEMRRDPRSSDLAADAEALHDVPWDEPAVTALYRDMLAERHPGEAAGIARRLGLPQQTAALPPRRRGLPDLSRLRT